MGMSELPNGLEYFVFSEELSLWTDQLYSIITPLNIAILVVLTMVFFCIIVFHVFYTGKKQIEGMG